MMKVKNNIVLLLLSTTFLFCSKKKRDFAKDYYSGIVIDSLNKYDGTLFKYRVAYKENGIFVGHDTLFNPDGSVLLIRKYEKGKLSGDFYSFFDKDSTKVFMYEKYVKGLNIFQKVYCEDGRVGNISTLHKAVAYYCDSGKIRRFMVKSANNNTLIKFDSKGEIESIDGDWRMVKSDELDLCYPDWKDKVKVYIQNNNPR